jgi:GT2 family glycosyltransferase
LAQVSAVIVAFGAEPWLERSVSAAVDSDGVDVEVVLVDNGCTDGAVDRLDGQPGVQVVRPGSNLGFAGGCNAGVERASGELIALVNPDALVEPGALAALVAVARQPDVGIATASVRLADDPSRLNSAGNEIHFSGVSWSGHFQELADDHDAARDVAAASGAALAVRAETWRDLGGFSPEFFAYYEDADLSLRAWQRGLRVVFVPDAVAVHRYEFGRRPEKFFLLERNRLIMVLSCFEARTLLVLAPVLLVLELGFLLMGMSQGWGRQKVRSWLWLLTHCRDLRARRRRVQSQRRVADSALLHLLAEDLLPGNLPPPAWFGPVNWVLRGYWRVALRLLTGPRER